MKEKKCNCPEFYKIIYDADFCIYETTKYKWFIYPENHKIIDDREDDKLTDHRRDLLSCFSLETALQSPDPVCPDYLDHVFWDSKDNRGYKYTKGPLKYYRYETLDDIKRDFPSFGDIEKRIKASVVMESFEAYLERISKENK